MREIRRAIFGVSVGLVWGVDSYAPYQTYKYTNEGTPDLTKPINTYYNLPAFIDGLRLNFGIGYPF